MSLNLSIAIDKDEALSLVRDGKTVVGSKAPLGVAMLNGQTAAMGYTRTLTENGRKVGLVDTVLPDGTRLSISDSWSPYDASTWQCDRTICILEAGKTEGLRFTLEVETSFANTEGVEDFEFYAAGSLYKKNDTDHDGKEDYLGTFDQDFRDDRLGNMTVMAFAPREKTYVALSRAVAPVRDVEINNDQLLARNFTLDTDIGSLGLSPRGCQIALGASYPFSERNTFCLNIDGDGWAAYLPNETGRTAMISYHLRIVAAEDLTGAIWDVTTHRKAALDPHPVTLKFKYEDSLRWRQEMTQQSYYMWPKSVDERNAAGYRYHFSPREGTPHGSFLEYGFAGAQTLLAYDAICDGYQSNIPLWVGRARTVIDFFVKTCQLDNGFSYGIYDVEKRDNVYWFTGILLPFQYSDDEATLTAYLGKQITRALLPVASELKKIKGNYTRTMCDSIYPILLAYRQEKKHGVSHPDWLAAAIRFGDFLLKTQNADGSWYRGYTEAGEPILAPAAWFGASDTEQKSGTIFPIEVLKELHAITGEAKYLNSLWKAGDYIVTNMIDPVEYVGGLNDTTHVKSVKVDSVGVMFTMRSAIKAYEATKEPRFLAAAVKAARILASWVYVWKVPLPADTLLGRANYDTTGWVACDVIPGGSYLDNEFLEFTCDLVRIAEAAGDEALFDFAELVQQGMQQALSTPVDMLGYVAPGIQCEGIMTGYWLSDPETTAFSGAANKVKGQDNDTANGLTNGQAGYSYFDLMDTYGTADFRQLRHKIFSKNSEVDRA